MEGAQFCMERFFPSSAIRAKDVMWVWLCPQAKKLPWTALGMGSPQKKGVFLHLLLSPISYPKPAEKAVSKSLTPNTMCLPIHT